MDVQSGVGLLCGRRLTVFGGSLYGQTGSVASPFYPREYPHQVTYTWTVTVRVGWLVKATFQTMDLEGPWRGNCAYDYVRVRPPRSFLHCLRHKLAGYCCHRRLPVCMSVCLSVNRITRNVFGEFSWNPYTMTTKKSVKFWQVRVRVRQLRRLGLI